MSAGQPLPVVARRVGAEGDERRPGPDDRGDVHQERGQVVVDLPRTLAVAVRRRVEDDAVVRLAAAALALDERRGRRPRASGSARPRARTARRCGAPRRAPAATRPRGRRRRRRGHRRASTPPVYANSDSTRGWRPSFTAASRTDLSSQAQVAACSGKTPTWPPAAARHSSVRPATRTGHGSLAAPRTQALFAQRRVGFAQCGRRRGGGRASPSAPVGPRSRRRTAPAGARRRSRGARGPPCGHRRTSPADVVARACSRHGRRRHRH